MKVTNKNMRKDKEYGYEERKKWTEKKRKWSE